MTWSLDARISVTLVADEAALAAALAVTLMDEVRPQSPPAQVPLAKSQWKISRR